MPENEATFAISNGGVTDAKEWNMKRRDKTRGAEEK